MDKVLTILLILLCLGASQAQTLESFNKKRLRTTRIGMTVLGGWALTNLTVSPILASSSSGSDKYFYRMNAYWNVVNLALAIPGYLKASRTDPASLTLTSSFKEQNQMEKLLLVNVGLDLAYMATGGFLIERSKNTAEQVNRLKGFGQSLILQGGFLLMFDVSLYTILQRHGKSLYPFLSQVSIAPSGIGLSYRF